LAYRLSTSKVTLSNLNSNTPRLYNFLEQSQQLRKCWQKIWNPVYKMTVNWVNKTIRWMTQRKALEWWKMTKWNCKITLIWSVVKFLIKRSGPKAPVAVHGPLGLKFCLLGRANWLIPDDLCDENHELQV
jgi:hypothetical protein